MTKKTPAGTDANKVRAQNNASAAGQSQEFASETNAADVRQKNQQSQAKKQQQQG